MCVWGGGGGGRGRGVIIGNLRYYLLKVKFDLFDFIFLVCVCVGGGGGEGGYYRNFTVLLVQGEI